MELAGRFYVIHILCSVADVIISWYLLPNQRGLEAWRRTDIQRCIGSSGVGDDHSCMGARWHSWRWAAGNTYRYTSPQVQSTCKKAGYAQDSSVFSLAMISIISKGRLAPEVNALQACV